MERGPLNVYRFAENPLVTPDDVPPSFDGWEVVSAFNAGVTEHNGEVVLLLRVAEKPKANSPDQVLVPVLDCDSGKPTIRVLEFSASDPDINLNDPRTVNFPDRMYLTTISHLRVARSKDGVHFKVDPKPALFPDQPHEAFGLEDPRITRLDDTYYVVYKSVEPNGIAQCLASTRDFVWWEKHGMIFCPENMDAMLFPARIRGSYAALHRPMPRYMGAPNMWAAYSDDLIHWGRHKLLLTCTTGTWEGGRIGGGAVPFLTDKGWLEIYHAATQGERYCLGALLLDAEYPEKVLAKSPAPIIQPEAPYETNGFKPNVIFTCGAITKGDTVTIYYGACDETVCAASLSASEILDSLEPPAVCAGLTW